MSDPMTNVEIEDVLSSIRRLVAQDPPSRPVSPGRLILTPALRVDEPAAGPEQEQAAEGAPSEAVFAHAWRSDTAASAAAPAHTAAGDAAGPDQAAFEAAPSDDALVASPSPAARATPEDDAPQPVPETGFVEEQVAGAPGIGPLGARETDGEEVEASAPPELGRAAPQDARPAPVDPEAPQAIPNDRAEASATSGSIAETTTEHPAPLDEIPPAPFHHVGDEEVAESEAAEAALSVPTPFIRHRDRKSLEDTVAELEAAVSCQNFEWEPDGVEPQEGATLDGSGNAAPEAEPAMPHAGGIEEATSIPAGSVPSPRGEDDAGAGLEADLLAEFGSPTQEGDAAAGDEDVAAADSAPVVFLSASRRHRQENSAPGERQDEIRQEAGDVEIAEATMLPAAEAGQFLPALPLDEDALRELVAKVLREELRGELGERITRNVRKLVRREIAQIISGLEVD